MKTDTRRCMRGLKQDGPPEILTVSYLPLPRPPANCPSLRNNSIVQRALNPATHIAAPSAVCDSLSPCPTHLPPKSPESAPAFPELSCPLDSPYSNRPPSCPRALLPSFGNHRSFHTFLLDHQKLVFHALQHQRAHGGGSHSCSLVAVCC